jgi:hypothetical protein
LIGGFLRDGRAAVDGQILPDMAGTCSLRARRDASLRYAEMSVMDTGRFKTYLLCTVYTQKGRNFYG